MEEKQTKKIKVYEELAYLFGIIFMALSVAMIAATNFGVSMIVAPAYVVSLKLPISFGVAEYIVQAILIVVMCIILRKFRVVYLFSIVTALFYGAVLDLWRLIPILNPEITEPGSMDLWLKIVFFVVGEIITAFTVALVMKQYIYPEVYDVFVNKIVEKFNFKFTVFKTAYDISSLVVAVILSLIFFGAIEGVGFGTIIIAVVNGFVIGKFRELIDKHFDLVPIFPKAKAYFIK